MQLCFGCAKKLVLAKIGNVIYVHKWVTTNIEPKIDASMKEEYTKIMGRTKIKQLIPLNDPVEPLAVTTLRNLPQLPSYRVTELALNNFKILKHY